MKLQLASAQVPRLGESVCGDDVLIIEDQVTLVVVVDGLGHGAEAAKAAQCFTTFAQQARHLSPREIIETAHRDMSKTRGAVASVAKFDTQTSTAVLAGVGNIEVRSKSQAPISPIFTPGIIGRPVRYVREFEYDLAHGDLIVFASDGISRRLDIKPLAVLPVTDIADRILREFGANHDDATCVAVRVEA